MENIIAGIITSITVVSYAERHWTWAPLCVISVVCADLREQDRLHSSCSINGGASETLWSTWWLHPSDKPSEASQEDPNHSSVTRPTDAATWLLTIFLVFF